MFVISVGQFGRIPRRHGRGETHTAKPYGHPPGRHRRSSCCRQLMSIRLREGYGYSTLSVGDVLMRLCCRVVQCRGHANDAENCSSCQQPSVRGPPFVQKNSVLLRTSRSSTFDHDVGRYEEYWQSICGGFHAGHYHCGSHYPRFHETVSAYRRLVWVTNTSLQYRSAIHQQNERCHYPCCDTSSTHCQGAHALSRSAWKCRNNWVKDRMTSQ